MSIDARPTVSDPDSETDTRWLDDDEQRAWRSFVTGVTALFDTLDRELREGHGVSSAEYEVMVRLSEAPGHELRMAELASSVSHSRSRTTHTIARMERDGIVGRRACPSDGRGVMAVLTEAGFRRLQEAAHTHVQGVRRHLVDLADPADFQAMGRVFDAVKASGTLDRYDA
jgi:DNA-binding MarR family transcriptional regulator